ncbi:hypothetical protein [Pseudomonas putida]|uniref:Imidazoleglycerol-phosphate synthase n=1 Tax=Pseudomonas putida TaxID=303 RepID=A0A6I6XVB4_PSEPU|nr:hypothetical protein [Pseudomonas putida]QHG63928.2 hypothetical protein C2H86_05615 [Pseudomonas putida]
MTSNSKTELLETLAKGPALYGWGAIMALGRDCLNTLIEAKFLERLSLHDFIKPITEALYIDAHCTEQIAFEALTFGPPALSFEQATGGTGRVLVHMPLIAGRCSEVSMFPGVPKYVRRTHQLVHGLGYTLQVAVDLKVVKVQELGNEHLQLMFDLREASEATCNLSADTVRAKRIGELMLEQLLKQTAFAQPFGFLTIAPYGKDAFTVAEVTPFTQRAPDGAGAGSLPQADGAVVLVMQLEGTGRPGLSPNALPYLLPRNVDENDNAGFALLIDKVRSQIRSTQVSRMLAQLILPGGFTLSASDEHEPYDLIGFGELEASSRMAWLSPGLSSIAAGERVQYLSNGVPVYGWQAQGLGNAGTAGTFRDGGLYHSRPVEECGSGQRLIVVTAKTSTAADAATRAALIVESAEGLTISPRVVTWHSGDADVVLHASGSGNLDWRLLGEPQGELLPATAGAGQRVFKPKPVSTPFVRLQRIEVSDGKYTGHATIVMLGVGHVLDVEPFPWPRSSPLSQQQLRLADGMQARWQLWGPGTIDVDTGLYSAPAQTSDEVSVAVAFAGPLAGAAIIEHQTSAPTKAMATEDRWKTLLEFSLKLNNSARNVVFANGLQQVGIDIVIATHSFKDSNGDDKWDPVSDEELATLVLTDRIGNPLRYVKSGELGIPEGSPEKWMGNKQRNMIDYYPVTSSAAVPEPRGADDGKRTVTVYVHSREAEVTHLRATFQDYRKGWHYSIEKNEEDGEIELQGIAVPLPSLGYFNWPAEGERIKSEGGKIENDDKFNYYHYTTDYWELSGRDISFARVEFDSYSIATWESEQVAETFASYLGCAFQPRRSEDAPHVPVGILYQAELELMFKEEAIKFDRLEYKLEDKVTGGALALVLQRASSLKTWDGYDDKDYTKVLQGSIKINIVDNYGNTHRLMVYHPSVEDGRNYLTLKLQ